MQKGIYERFIKRPQDLIFAVAALIILCPVLLILAVFVRVKLGAPIIFKQKRPGIKEKIFTLYKFRTMTVEKDNNGRLLPDEARLTRFGQFLRSTSLDELPELWNIVRGDMAIVGPRPQLVKDMVFMTNLQRERHIVLPGLTGLAQINGRNCILWEDKLKYDIQYIKNITFFQDWKIIVRTIGKVLNRDNISAEGMATAEDLGDYLLRVGKIDVEYYNKALEKSQ